MKKIFISLLIISLSGIVSQAQNVLTSTDDFGRLSLTPIIASNANIPSYSTALVKSKLIQIVTQNGLSCESLDNRFVITANMVEVSKEITATMPTMVAVAVAPTLYIGDLETGKLFASCSLPMIKGVGTDETKAYISAINSMRLSDSSIAKFVNTGKNKIIEYYNSQIDFILSQAETLSNQERYDEAIVLLLSVPNVCKDAYLRAMDMASVVFQKEIDKDGATLLNTARQVWNANQSYEGAETAGEYLSQINPNSSYYVDAAKLSEEIAKRIKEIDKREWNLLLKQHDDDVQLKRKAIEAIRAIGEARAKQTATYNTKVYWW